MRPRPLPLPQTLRRRRNFVGEFLRGYQSKYGFGERGGGWPALRSRFTLPGNSSRLTIRT
jgi:hypothetical protein